MEAVAFQYAPLDHNSTSFRLLHLLPGLSETPIQCHIFNTLVSEWENRYVAGSYVWGQPHSEKDIVLNGKPFKIRENLYAFLSAVRICLDKPLAIWVDAICIDQSSILERNHQVGMMDVVYSNATATWSWLGPGSPDTDWFFETLANTPEYDDLKSPFDMEKHYPRHDMYKGSAILLGDIAAREYWTRIWIVQEMFLAKKVVLLCGTKKLGWAKLRVHMHELNAAHTCDLQTQLLKEISCSQLWLHLEPETCKGFADAIFQFGQLRSTIAQDKIFALVNIKTRDNAKEKILIDYDVELWELLCQALHIPQMFSVLTFASALRGALSLSVEDLKPNTNYEDREVSIPICQIGYPDFSGKGFCLFLVQDLLKGKLKNRSPWIGALQLSRNPKINLIFQVKRPINRNNAHLELEIIGLQVYNGVRHLQHPSATTEQDREIWDTPFREFVHASGIRRNVPGLDTGWLSHVDHNREEASVVLETYLGPLMRLVASFEQYMLDQVD